MSRQNSDLKGSLHQRLRLLREGLLSESETASFAADAGSENFIEARKEIEGLLYHTSPIVRFNALATLAYEWGIASDPSRIVDIALSDADRECRRQAAGALGSLFRGTKNAETLHCLASIAARVEELPDVRAFAYTAALDVLGVPRSAQPVPTRLIVGEEELSALKRLLRAA